MLPLRRPSTDQPVDHLWPVHSPSSPALFPLLLRLSHSFPPRRAAGLVLAVEPAGPVDRAYKILVTSLLCCLACLSGTESRVSVLILDPPVAIAKLRNRLPFISDHVDLSRGPVDGSREGTRFRDGGKGRETCRAAASGAAGMDSPLTVEGHEDIWS